MDNNLFKSVIIYNKLLKSKIFDQVNYIHRIIFNNEDSVKWSTLLHKPTYMVGNNYLDLLDNYCKYHIDRFIQFEDNHNNYNKNNCQDKQNFFPNSLISILVHSLRVGNITLLFKLLDKYRNTEFLPRFFKGDLLYHACIYIDSRLDVISYIISFENEFNKWQYDSILLKVIKYKDINNNNTISLDIIKCLIKKIEENEANETISMNSHSEFTNNMQPLSFSFSTYGGSVKTESMKQLLPKAIRASIGICGSGGQSLKILQYLWLLKEVRQINIDMNDIYLSLFENPSIIALEWLFDTAGVPAPTSFYLDSILDIGASNITIEFIEYIHKRYSSRVIGSVETMTKVASSGRLDIIEWLHNNRTEKCSTNAMDNAAISGHLNIVKFLHENRTEGCSQYAVDGAASENHIKVVQYLLENRTEGCSVNAMSDAIRGGNLEMVKLLHENKRSTKVGYNPSSMDFAAGYLGLEMVEYLHNNRTEGCTFNAMDMAASVGNLRVLKFLHLNRTEGCTLAAMQSSCLNGSIDAVEYLYDNNLCTYCQDDALILKVLQLGYNRVFQWLLDHHPNPEKIKFDALMSFAKLRKCQPSIESLEEFKKNKLNNK